MWILQRERSSDTSLPYSPSFMVKPPPRPSKSMSYNFQSLATRVRKRRHPRVTLGSSLGESLNSPSPPINLNSTFVSPNRFAPLAPEYSPLAFVEVEIKAGNSESERWVPTRAMVDCGRQGSFINNNFSQQYQLSCHPKSYPVSLVLADGSQSKAGHIIQYNPVILCTAGNEESLSLDVTLTPHD